MSECKKSSIYAVFRTFFAVSKTACPEFEPLCPCQNKRPPNGGLLFSYGIRKGERVFRQKNAWAALCGRQSHFVPLLYLGFEAQYRTRYCTSNFFDYWSDSFSLFCARIFPFFSDFLCQFICQKICQPQHPKKRLRKPYKNESAGSQNAVGRFVLIWLRTTFFVFTP